MGRKVPKRGAFLIMNTASSLEGMTKHAAKWALFTEALVKIISPVSQMILARVLAPEAFGMVATVTMVVNFADMFSDAGFQKYLVQHKFSDNESLSRNATVAFWTNLTISIVLWLLIALFNEPLASFVGNPSLGFPLMIACLSLPLTAFSSIQTALFHRKLNFKSIMPARVASSLVTFVITLILAFWKYGYWSLIIGTLMGNVVNAVLLTVMSDWKPVAFYSAHLLRQMLSFSGWTLLESLSIWLTTWSGTFIVGNILGSADLGLYKTPITFVEGCYNIIANSTTPILFSSLSKLQNSRNDYMTYFYKFQYVIGLVLLPVSFGIFVFREQLVILLLGNQWAQSAEMFGLYGLTQGPIILFSYYCSEMYRSLGKPLVSTLVQVLFMSVMIPLMVYAAQNGFEMVVLISAITRIMLIAINQVVATIIVGTSFLKMLMSLREPIIATLIMGFLAVCMRQFASFNLSCFLISVVGCITTYFIVCMLFSKTRMTILTLVKCRRLGAE